MPVMVLDVPIPAWNQVVLQSVLHGLDMSPDNHRSVGSTIVEVTGTWEKLQQVLTRIKQKAPETPELLAVMESKLID
jgi:hypothetical protein